MPVYLVISSLRLELRHLKRLFLLDSSVLPREFAKNRYYLVMGMLKCCVGGCTATSETHQLFCFPTNDNLRNLWMSFLVPTNPLLLGLTKNQLEKKRVCKIHFDEEQFDNDGRRLRYSYPCLFTEQEIKHGIPLNSEEYKVLSEHNYFQEQNEEDIPDSSVVSEKADHGHGEASSTFTKNNEVSVLSEHNYMSSTNINVNSGPSQSIERAGDIYHEKPSCSFWKNDNEKHELPSSAGQVLSAGSALLQENVRRTAGVFLEQPKTLQVPISSPKQKALKIRKMGTKKRKLMKQIRTIANKSLGDSASQRLNQAQMVFDSSIVEDFNALPKQTKTFLYMQLKQIRKKKMARRFTLDEKLIALMLMKQSPKGYKLLEKMFCLPNKRTLSRLSENIKFEPGLNKQIFEHVKKTIKNWDTKNKLCSIVYDEVALIPHLTYDEKNDVIIGFEDVAGKRKFKYCDHALVFMVRGICASWRQCIAYYFCESTVSASELQVILKDIVTHVAETGLIPLGLVSDQGSTFRTAIRNLKLETLRFRNLKGQNDDGTICLAGHELNVFFDPPHLLKGLRNNFLTKDILWEGKTASWKDIIFIYDVDSKLGHTRAIPKLTAHHVDPTKIKKMKVSVAAQVLSARTAAMLKYTAAVNKNHEQNSTMNTTADVVEFFDNLFDSVNGYPGGARKGKYRNAVKPNSPHCKFWEDAIKKIKTIKFKDDSSKIVTRTGIPRLVRVPSLDGWIITLESFLRISKLLFEKYNVDYYYPRFINQDPLENFFGRIRAVNYRNVNPDAHTFKYSFKSLVLSNILSPHSKNCNCEEDDGETLLNIDFLFKDKFTDYNDKENVPPIANIHNLTSSPQNRPSDLADQVILEKIKVHCSAYTAGYICRKITKFVNCRTCLKSYTSNNIDNIHQYIQYREYKTLKNNNLAYPNEKFLRLYRESAQIIHDYLNINCYNRNVVKNLQPYLARLSYSWLGCEKHKTIVETKFKKIITRLQVHNWCNIINKIFKGDVEEKYVNKMQQAQKKAFVKYKSTRKKKCRNK